MLRNGYLINRTDRGSVKRSFVEMYKEKMFEDRFFLCREPLTDASIYSRAGYDDLTNGYPGGSLLSPFM